MGKADYSGIRGRDMMGVMLGTTMFEIGAMIAVVIAALVVLVVLATLWQYFRLWLQCTLSNCPIPIMAMVGMKFRRVNPQMVAISYIRASKGSVTVTPAQLEAHYLAGGDVTAAVTAAITDQRTTGEDRFEMWCTIDLAGYDVMDAANRVAAGRLDLARFSIDVLQRAGVQRRYDH